MAIVLYSSFINTIIIIAKLRNTKSKDTNNKYYEQNMSKVCI